MTKINAKTIIKSLLSSSIGNVLEWYEYTLYAYFATVISDLFFPADNPYVSLIMTFATFAIGLAARPIGGIIFGHIGDKFSRKKMLVISMLLMSIPTLCIGMLPTYQQIGILAPIILITLRILQGVALGGEFGASCVYLFESAPPKNRNFFGCLALTGVGLGLTLSACTILIIEMLATQAEIYAFAWRIPFFISVFGALIGFYMRTTLLETKDFEIAKNNNQLVKHPFLEMIKNHKKKIINVFSIFITTQVAFFIVFIFGKSMMIKFLGYSDRLAGKFNLLTVASYTLSTLVFGYLSDKINKKYLIMFGAIGIFVCAYPFIFSIKAGVTILIILFSILMGIFIGITEGTLNPVVSESFPINIRATSVAFCWNFTAIAFGGIAPIISMWLIEYSGSVDIIAYYLMTVCAITITVLGWSLLKRKN